jgi:hypothetical protein
MAKSDNPFRWFDSSPEVIQLVVMLYVRFPSTLGSHPEAEFSGQRSRSVKNFAITA